MRFLTTLMTAALVLSNGPALAAGATTTQPRPAMPAKATASAASPNVKYCVDDDATGTRIHGRQCKTKAEWAKAGVDVDHPQDQ
jgi:hypothetical protein